jgi:hypothetical protein
VLLALLSILVLAVRLDLDFDRERIGVRGPHRVDGGRLAIDLPSLNELAGHPAALVLHLRGGAESTPLDVRFDGRQVAQATLRPGRNARIDATVHPSPGAAHRLELAGADTGWRVREIEVANVHGFSRPPLSVVVVPRGRPPDQPLPWGALALLAAALWHWRPRSEWPRRRLPRAVHRAAATLVALTLGVALVAEWLTPFRILFGPATMALGLAVLYADRVWQGAGRVAVAARSPGGAIRILVVVIAAIVLWLGLAAGSRAVGGADVYGYVSQARLLQQGAIRVHQPIAANVPWPEADWTLAPLGYAPGGGQTIVPTYPPGLPLLIILFSFVFGGLGPFLVGPASAAALVVLTYALGARLTTPLIGLAAALLVGSSPTVLFTMLTPMSDVAVAVCWVAALLLALGGTSRGALAAGTAAGIAILIRPNLVPLAVVPLLVSLAAGRPGPSTMLRRAAAYGLSCAPFALFIAWWFNELYGSPLRSGYGDNAGLFAWGHVAENLARYPAWLWATQGPLVFLAPLSPVLARDNRARLLRLACLAFIGLVTISYLLYIPFEDWRYLRFFIVTFPLLFILSADAVAGAAGRISPAWRAGALGAFAAVSLFYAVSTTLEHRTFAGGRADHRYADVGRFAREQLPANAVVYAMQHSGTIRYYTNLLTVRWTHLEPAWLDPSIDYWIAAGYEPVLLLDDWEVPEFLARFGATTHGPRVAVEPARAACSHAIFVYRVVERPGQDPAVRVPRIPCE